MDQLNFKCCFACVTIIYKMFNRNYQGTPCRNGPTCYYLHHGTCWFFHPDWHSNHLLGNVLRMPTITYSNPIRNHSQLQNHNPIRIRTMNDLIDTLDMRAQLQELSQQSKKRENKQQSQKIEIKQLIMGGKQVKLISVKSQLDRQKAWFFENSYHFHHFPQCELHECSICINNFQQGDLLSTFYCNHGFHNKCIEEWLKSSQQCPLCRKDFRTHQAFKTIPGYKAPSSNKIMTIRDYLTLNLRQSQQSNSDDGDISLDFDEDDDEDDYQYNYFDHHDDFDEFNVDYQDF